MGGAPERFDEVVIARGEEPRRSGPDRVIADLAARQRGVVSRAQLEAAGLGRNAITHRVRQGRLHRLHRGVYLLGHRLPVALAREQAALFAVPGALLSHRSAALLWRLPVAPSREVDVTVVGGSRTQQADIRIHRVPELHPRDARSHKGLPLTAPARTLLDLAAVIPTPRLEQAVAEALARRITSATALRETLERTPRRHGAKALRELLDRENKPAHTRSRAERLMLALVRRHRLPEPETNVQLEQWNVDFLWRNQGLIVEVNSYGFHSSPAAWERDHLKESELEDSSWRVRRVTYGQLRDEPNAVAERLKRWLRAA